MTALTLIPAVLIAALSPADVAQAPRSPMPPTERGDVGVDDARRAAAARLLEVSRFRERQAVTTEEALRAAQAGLASECIDRATEGRALTDCRSTAKLSPGAASRLATSQSRLLDEVMVASQTIYARSFTAAEMDEIARFFRTPVGQKYGRLYPQILTEVTARKTTIARRYLIEATRAPAGRR